MNNDCLYYLQKSRETDLHKEIVLPLLQKMGFSNVIYTHGTAEKGKDFIMTAENIVKDTELWVCQVKNESFSGKAGHKANTRGVVQQLNDCMLIKCHNPITGKNEIPSKVLFITTYDLQDKDLQGADELLKYFGKNIHLIGPNKLIDLIRIHLPDIYNRHSGVAEQLREAFESYASSTTRIESLGVPNNLEEPFYINLGITHHMPLLKQLEQKSLYVYNDRERHCIDMEEKDVLKLIRTCSMGKPYGVNTPTIKYLSREEDEGGKKKMLATVEYIRVGSFVSEIAEHISNTIAVRDRGYLAHTLSAVGVTQHVLQILYETFSSNLFVDAEDLKDTSQQYKGVGIAESELYIFNIDFDIGDVSPDEFITVEDNIAIYGTAGAGKTSLAQAIYHQAQKYNLSVLYYPCYKINGTCLPKLGLRDWSLRANIRASWIRNLRVRDVRIASGWSEKSRS